MAKEESIGCFGRHLSEGQRVMHKKHMPMPPKTLCLSKQCNNLFNERLLENTCSRLGRKTLLNSERCYSSNLDMKFQQDNYFYKKIRIRKCIIWIKKLINKILLD